MIPDVTDICPENSPSGEPIDSCFICGGELYKGCEAYKTEDGYVCPWCLYNYVQALLTDPADGEDWIDVLGEDLDEAVRIFRLNYGVKEL